MKTSPLNDKHIARNAKMADFGGWLMPIEYPGGGVLAEHTAVRERVGIFDVSHLGKASVIGVGAIDFLNDGLIGILPVKQMVPRARSEKHVHSCAIASSSSIVLTMPRPASASAIEAKRSALLAGEDRR